jgi:hypothetical protein
MSKTVFNGLIILTLLAVAAAFMLGRETPSTDASPSSLLLPQLEDQVNDVDWLRVSAGGETIATARRDGTAWVIDEAGAYHADWDQLQALLSGLASARVIEPKTRNPDYYDRLGVEDPARPGATGVFVEFQPESGLPGVVVGRQAQGREGQYLRLVDSDQAMLVDREFDLPRTIRGWIESDVIDIADDEVVEVAITHSGDNVVVARKVSADDEDFVLQDVPAGMEPRTQWAVNSLAGGLSNLTAEEVRPADEMDWEGAVRYRVVTADGLLVEAQAVFLLAGGDRDEGHWVRLEAGVYTTALDGASDEEDAALTTGRAQEVNRRVRGWAYRIPKSRFDTMTTAMDGLLEPAVVEE